jgi:hypothetical protein
MHSMKLRFLAAASVVMACGAAFGADAVSQSVALAQSQVKQAFPGVQIARDESSVVRVYGRRMSGHTDADAAVQAWLAAHASSLGATNPTLELERMNEVSFGRFTVYSYDQTIDGLPVEHSHARVLVRHGESNDVVYAAGRLAEAPADGFAPRCVQCGRCAPGRPGRCPLRLHDRVDRAHHGRLLRRDRSHDSDSRLALHR